jgi:hypothetical protein
MRWQDYQLENIILKAKEALTLWQTEKGIIEISKNTLAIPIRIGEKRKGYVFHGHGRLVLDAIVETREGAIGKPIEKEIKEPFLMIGNIEEILYHFTAANKEDLTTIGFESEKEFMNEAEDLCFNFFGKRLGVYHYYEQDNGFIFAFKNEIDSLDMLIAKGSQLVYKATDKMFVYSKNKVVLKTPKEVILSSDQRSFVIKNDF